MHAGLPLCAGGRKGSSGGGVTTRRSRKTEPARPKKGGAADGDDSEARCFRDTGARVRASFCDRKQMRLSLAGPHTPRFRARQMMAAQSCQASIASQTRRRPVLSTTASVRVLFRVGRGWGGGRFWHFVISWSAGATRWRTRYGTWNGSDRSVL